jgi:ribosomal protein L9
MKSRKHTQLKRHPFVRFVRGIVRLFRVLIQPKQRKHRAVRDENLERENLEKLAAHQQKLEQIELEQIELERHERAQLITVGELFGQVKWQFSSETIDRANISVPSSNTRTHDVSRN